MARPKKIKIVDTEIQPAVEKSAVMALSKSQTMDMMKEIVLADYPEFSGDLVVVLGERAINYLYARFNGMNHVEAVQIYNYAPIEVELWSKKPEFTSIMAVVKQAEASIAEAIVWENSIKNPAASIERMFALKARKAEYKENGQPVSQTVTNVRISIEGQEFDVSANFKDKEVE